MGRLNFPLPEDTPTFMPTRFRGRMTYPYAAVVDRWLPILLLVGRAGVGGDHDVYVGRLRHAGPVCRAVDHSADHLPGTDFPDGVGRRKHGGARCRLWLPRTSTWRALATFMPTFALGAVLWMVSEGRISALVLGLIAGLLLSCRRRCGCCFICSPPRCPWRRDMPAG